MCLDFLIEKKKKGVSLKVAKNFGSIRETGMMSPVNVTVLDANDPPFLV